MGRDETEAPTSELAPVAAPGALSEREQQVAQGHLLLERLEPSRGSGLGDTDTLGTALKKGQRLGNFVLEDLMGPRGEVNLCFAVDGEPRFDGQAEGWVTFAPDSQHVPTVSDGRMLIVYFLPGGEVEWIT